MLTKFLETLRRALLDLLCKYLHETRDPGNENSDVHQKIDDKTKVLYLRVHTDKMSIALASEKRKLWEKEGDNNELRQKDKKKSKKLCLWRMMNVIKKIAIFLS